MKMRVINQPSWELFCDLNNKKSEFQNEISGVNLKTNVDHVWGTGQKTMQDESGISSMCEWDSRRAEKTVTEP